MADQIQANGATYNISQPVGMEANHSGLQGFVDAALSEVAESLEANRKDAEKMGIDASETVEEVLAPENVREIDVRARPLENPKVTVWLADCPTWANTADKAYCYPRGLNAYNSKLTYTYDVRPQ